MKKILGTSIPAQCSRVPVSWLFFFTFATTPSWASGTGVGPGTDRWHKEDLDGGYYHRKLTTAPPHWVHPTATFQLKHETVTRSLKTMMDNGTHFNIQIWCHAHYLSCIFGFEGSALRRMGVQQYNKKIIMWNPIKFMCITRVLSPGSPFCSHPAHVLTLVYCVSQP